MAIDNAHTVPGRTYHLYQREYIVVLYLLGKNQNCHFCQSHRSLTTHNFKVINCTILKPNTYCIIVFNSLEVFFWLYIYCSNFQGDPCDRRCILVLIGVSYAQYIIKLVLQMCSILIYLMKTVMPSYTTANVMLLCKCIGYNK